MFPIYRFQLSADTDTRQAFPVYGQDLAIDYELEQNQQFYRGKLSGKLTFQKDDAAFIRAKAFDTQFDLVISISYNGGQTWAAYWHGQFWKTDCEFNDDDDTIIVTPNVNDRYNSVLAGMAKEYNLIELAPEILPVVADKRPIIQIYVPGDTTLACIMAGMWWEQECQSVTEDETIDVGGQTVNKLTEYLFFVKNVSKQIVNVMGTTTPVIPSSFIGNGPDPTTHQWTYTHGGYSVSFTWQQSPGYYDVEWSIIRLSDNVVLWYYRDAWTTLPADDDSYSVTLEPRNGATGVVTLEIGVVSVYARYVCDVENIGTLQTEPLPVEDITAINPNYTRVAGYNFPDTIIYSNTLVSFPTPWGIYQPGRYYAPPSALIEYFPISRRTWGNFSLWFANYMSQVLPESLARKEATLRDAYPLDSVISVLLNQIAPGVTFQPTDAYSEFLYGFNAITEIDQYLFLTPKSNVKNLGYDQPAQKAMITLQSITDMLRDCFRCYWFIDEQNRFRIEHISWFINGGSYEDEPVVGIDLTQEVVMRNGKPWSYVRNQYQFDKPEMAARYQFGWMDDVTQLFEGYPIDIVSKFVNQDNIENINVSNMTSDIDYIVANPSAISSDGFVLLAAVLQDGKYKLPYVNFNFLGADHNLQNAYVAFVYLQQYYAYDMPAPAYRINGEDYTALGVKKMRRQTLRFPVITEPNLMTLIKTGLGNGTIRKMSVNLSSRNAQTTLIYDTE